MTGAPARQHTKMVNRIAIASGLVGVCGALVHASRAGLEVSFVLALARLAAVEWPAKEARS